MIDSVDRAGIVKKMRDNLKRTEPYAKRYRDVAQVNERFCMGDQWGTTTWSAGGQTVIRDAWFDSEGVPRVYINHLNNLHLTWSSLLTYGRNSVMAVPATDEPEDTYRSRVAQRVVEYLTSELDTKNKVHQSVQFASQHGTAGLKIVYDANKDAVQWEPLTLFSYCIDPVADYHNAKWVIFERYLNLEEAEGLFERAQIQKSPTQAKYRNSAGDELEGVQAYEYWQKPCKEYPEGFYGFVIDGELVEYMPFPYVFENDSDEPEYLLPLVLMKVRNVRDSAYGGTNLTDCVPLQRAHNEVNARILKIVRQTSNPQLIVPKELVESIDLTRSNVLAFDRNQTEASREIRYTQPPEISKALYDLRDFYEAAMGKVIGLNEITAGTQTRSISGRAIDNIVQLDAQKNADASKSLEQMVIDAFRLTLALIQRFYTEPRKVKIAGADGADILMFSGADIQGVDIRLEPASELEQLDRVKGQDVAEKMQQGLASGTDMLRAQKSTSYGLSKRMAEDIIAAYLRGEDVDVKPADLNMGAFAEVIEKHRSRALSQGRKSDWLALGELLKIISDLESQAADAAPQAPSDKQEGSPDASLG